MRARMQQLATRADRAHVRFYSVRRLKIDGRESPGGHVRVMSWSPQRSPQALPVLVAIALSLQQSVSIAFFSHNHFSRALPPPHSRRLVFSPCSSAGKINLETHSPVRPITLGLLITHLILRSLVKTFNRSRSCLLSIHQQPCLKLRVISRRESRLLVAKQTV